MHRVEEVERELGLEVGTALRAPDGPRRPPPPPTRPPPGRRRAAVTEEPAEEVAEVDGVVEAGTRPRRGRSRSRRDRPDRRRPRPTRPSAGPRRTPCASRGRESTSLAAETSLNRSSAAVSPGFASGWYCFASFRYGARDVLLGRVRRTRRARSSSPSRTTRAAVPSVTFRTVRSLAGRPSPSRDAGPGP